MCGIVGFVNGSKNFGYQKRSNFLMQGLVCDSLRGVGGTGIAIVTEKGEIETFRKALPGPDFVHTEVAETAFGRIDGARLAIGHNRAATIGSVKDRNCHPFHYKDKREIVLVHNGTLNNHYQISPADFRHDVDSAHAARAIAASEDVQKTLKGIRGWFVFVWYDLTENTFNIARNNNRDIYYVRSEDGGLYFGSEYKMVDWLLDRNNIDLKKDAIFHYPQEHEWYVWKFEKDGGLAAKPKMFPIAPEKEKFNYPVVETYRGREDQGFRGGYNHLDLAKYDLVEQEDILFFVDKWEAYSANPQLPKERQFGKILGKVWDNNGNEQNALIHTVQLSRYELLMRHFDKAGLPCRVQGIQRVYANRKQDEVIILEVDLTKTSEIVKQNLAASRESTEPVKEAVKEIIKDAAKELDLSGQPKMVPVSTSLFVPESVFKERVKKGCEGCTNIPTTEQAKGVVWLENGYTNHEFLCPICGVDNEMRELVQLPALPKKQVVH